MTCESCVKDISGSLHKLSGIQKVEANLKDQLVTIEGTGMSSSNQVLASVDNGYQRPPQPSLPPSSLLVEMQFYAAPAARTVSHTNLCLVAMD